MTTTTTVGDRSKTGGSPGSTRSLEEEAFLQRVLLEALRRECREHPEALVNEMRAWDQRETKWFEFPMSDPADGWAWQLDVLRWFHGNERTIILKARQLGVTWLAGAYVLWVLLYRPGALALIYRQKEEDAIEIVQRIWTMWLSLPEALRAGATVLTPKSANARPTNVVVWRHPGGLESELRGMTSASSSGHGKTAAIVVMDECAHIEKADDLMAAVSSVLGVHGKLIVVSTANGRHDSITLEGNHFHYLWENAAETIERSENGFVRRFLPWSMHPDRNDVWYESAPEIRSLTPIQRLEQYPNSPEEAFAFSQSAFFDREAMAWYRDHAVREPLYYGDFWRLKRDRAEFRRRPEGRLAVFDEPHPKHRYAIGCDVSTGRGLDFSAAYVVDLETMAFCVELHGKFDADELALQLHYLGRWYGTALLAVESAGGYGDPVIYALRDGREGRPPYPNQYRHKIFSRGEPIEHKAWGFPVNRQTRPLITEGLEEAIRDHSFPWMPGRLLDECGNFVHHDTGASPRAAEGTHDDRVMAACITAELYRQRGVHPDRRRRRRAIEKPELARYG